MQNPLLISIEINQLCSLDCPFCYSRPRRTGCTWTRETLEQLINEAVRLDHEVAIVFGDGEPLLTPELTGWAMRKALDTGAIQTGFTTSGTPGQNIRAVEKSFGEPLTDPLASMTVSLDAYKARRQRRCTSQSDTVKRIWRLAHEFAGMPDKPPESLCTIEEAYHRGWTIVLNVLVTNELASMLPLLIELVGTGWTTQVNLLAPKPLRPLLDITMISTVRRAAKILARRGATVAVDGSMKQLLTGQPGCSAGDRLLSISACGTVRPCSFHYEEEKWTPGRLPVIAEKLRSIASPAREGYCPFLGLPHEIFSKRLPYLWPGRTRL